MTEITEAGFLAYLILGSALMIATFITIVEERRAFKTFRRCTRCGDRKRVHEQYFLLR